MGNRTLFGWVGDLEIGWAGWFFVFILFFFQRLASLGR